MRTYKNRGKEVKRYLYTFLLIPLLVCLFLRNVQADTVWESGHHEINDGDVYGEIWMYNDCTLDILGGEVSRLAAYDVTVTDWFGGQMLILWARDDSIVNIYGGTLGDLWAAENSLINLYAYDVIYHPTGGYYNLGWIEGRYLDNDLYFEFDLAGPDTFSHMNVVPQPLDAEVDVRPKTLDLKSKGKWITCHIWLPADYNVADIEPNSIVLEYDGNEIEPEWLWFNEEQNILMAKFSRSALQEILEPGDIELTVTGFLNDGSYFIGTDTIKVINKIHK